MKNFKPYFLSILISLASLNVEATEKLSSGIVLSKENFEASFKCVYEGIKGAGKIIGITATGTFLMAVNAPGELILSPFLDEKNLVLPILAKDIEVFNKEIYKKTSEHEACRKTQKAKNEQMVLDNKRKNKDQSVSVLQDEVVQNDYVESSSR